MLKAGALTRALTILVLLTGASLVLTEVVVRQGADAEPPAPRKESARPSAPTPPPERAPAPPRPHAAAPAVQALPPAAPTPPEVSTAEAGAPRVVYGGAVPGPATPQTGSLRQPSPSAPEPRPLQPPPPAIQAPPPLTQAPAVEAPPGAQAAAPVEPAPRAEPPPPSPAPGPAADAVDLNTASLEELNQLPGAGLIGRAIIRGRPYASPDDLLAKRVVNRSTYARIREHVTVR